MKIKKYIFVMILMSVGLLSAAQQNNPYTYNLIEEETFLILTDTPNNYTGAAGQCVKVSPTQTGLLFEVCNASIGDANATGLILNWSDIISGSNLNNSGLVLNWSNVIDIWAEAGNGTLAFNFSLEGYRTLGNRTFNGDINFSNNITVDGNVNATGNVSGLWAIFGNMSGFLDQSFILNPPWLTAITNIFDQSLNTTDNVVHNNLTITKNLSVGGGALFVDGNTGRVGIGTSTPITPLEIQSLAASMRQTRYSDTGVQSAGITVQRSGGTTVGTDVIVQDGWRIANFNLRGYDGATYRTAASIQAWIDGTPGGGDMPGRLTFLTTADGSSSATERMRIDSSGNVGIGTSSPKFLLEVAGNISALDWTNVSITEGQISNLNHNIFDQDLNTTSNVTHVNLTLNGELRLNLTNIKGVSNITVNDSIFYGESFAIRSLVSNDFVEGQVFAISFNETDPTHAEFGDFHPHVIFQSGGFGQANVITRSTIFVNENENILGTLNQTDCRAWADIENFTLQVDCNSTQTGGGGLGTGADVIIMGDSQVVGEFWLRDTTGEWKFLSRDLMLRDQFYTNLFFNNLTTSTLSGTNYSFSDLDTFVINIRANETILNISADNITLNAGDIASPILNYVHYADINNPSLEVNTSQPSGVAEVARILMGGINNVYSALSGITDNEQMARKLYAFAIDIGPIYVKGFDITSNATFLGADEGTASILLRRSVLNEINLSNGFFMVLNNATFINSSTLEDITQYSDGNTISNNKYYNVVMGIVHSDVSPSRMMLVVQSKPSSEYNNLQDAEVDKFDSTNFFPTDTASSDAQLQNTFLPLARVIIQKVGGADQLQLLSNGLFHFDERGLSSKAGASASPSITDHDELGKLEFNDSKHTFNNANEVLDIGSYNFTTSGDTFVSGDWNRSDGGTSMKILTGLIAGLPVTMVQCDAGFLGRNCAWESLILVDEQQDAGATLQFTDKGLTRAWTMAFNNATKNLELSNNGVGTNDFLILETTNLTEPYTFFVENLSNQAQTGWMSPSHNHSGTNDGGSIIPHENNVTSNAFNTRYTNNYLRPIQVWVTVRTSATDGVEDAYATIDIDNVAMSKCGQQDSASGSETGALAAVYATCWANIPVGSFYHVNTTISGSGTITLTHWIETED